MQFTSITEILRFAISKEQAAVRFYQELMSLTTNPQTQALFGVLIGREQEHIETLQLEVQKLGYTLETDQGTLNSEFQWDEHLDKNEQVLQMSFVDGLALAIQKERAAFRLYTQLLATSQKEEFSEILMDLAEEEMRHVLQLEREYESITHHKR